MEKQEEEAKAKVVIRWLPVGRHKYFSHMKKRGEVQGKGRHEVVKRRDMYGCVSMEKVRGRDSSETAAKTIRRIGMASTVYPPLPTPPPSNSQQIFFF